MGGWNEALGEFILEWDDVISSSDPHASGAGVRTGRRGACLSEVRVGSRAGGERAGRSSALELTRLTAAAALTVALGALTPQVSRSPDRIVPMRR